jgi:hypothetical protein
MQWGVHTQLWGIPGRRCNASGRQSVQCHHPQPQIKQRGRQQHRHQSIRTVLVFDHFFALEDATGYNNCWLEASSIRVIL